MTPDEKEAFTGVLAAIFQSNHKPLPNAQVLRIWWAKLESFSLADVTSALYLHLDVSAQAPTIADILKFLRTKGGVHPEADEAWAIAVRAADEQETVVWTDQIAEGWVIAKSVFDRGDEVGARMAFKAAYVRLVARANAMGQLVCWRISYGSDRERRQQAAEKAVREGRLRAEQIRDVLPPPDASRNSWPLLPRSGDHLERSGVGQEHLARLTRLLGTAMSAEARIAVQKSRKAQAQREQLKAKKRALAEQVRKYRRDHQGGKS